MPVYEYQCKACQKEFEYQQRMSDPDKTDCEACGGALERLISRTAFSLKGGGWYKDLYASAKPEAKSSDAKSDGGSSSDGAATKSDAPASTPAAAAPSTPSAPSAPSTPSTPAPAKPSGGGTSGSGGGGSGGKSAAARAQ
ncbi:MAG: zinc ribbon domain-containing protein [Myxococcota bacterium]|nr:zinc ribbon domain-containing protein [Deltaproteobacteria bacterium]MDQ3341259.1 zinc ribbon domain-containing protein [Myxococcota bacterium]